MYNPYYTQLDIIATNFIDFVRDYTGWIFLDNSKCMVIDFAKKHASPCTEEEDVWEVIEAAQNEIEWTIPGPDEFRRGWEEYGMSRDTFEESWEEFIVDMCEAAYAAAAFDKMHN